MNIDKSDTDKCRLCLSEHDKSDLTPLFTDIETPGISLATRIMICLSLPVEAKDSFPDCVCNVCEKRVTQFYTFRENCLNTYYFLLGRTNFWNKGEEYCEQDSNHEDNADTRLGIAKVEESVQDSEENTTENYVVCTDEQSVENYTRKAFISDTNSESNDERISQRDVEGNRLKAEVISVNTETNGDVDNFIYNSNDETNKEHLSEEKLPIEGNFVADPMEIVKYKCLRCDNLFADLDTASIHCARCSQDDSDQFAECTIETVEYLEENYDEKTENSDNSKEHPQIYANEFSTDLSKKHYDTKLRYDRGTSSTTGDVKNSKILRTKLSLNDRKRKIQQIKTSHSCSDCESVFLSAALLKRHTVVHTGERPFECSICNKRFSQVGQLNFHKNFHENPRYRCDVCKKPFLRPSDIAKHMRTHTGEKPYVCGICSKSFAQLVALQQHDRIHTGVKPYVCEICDKRFSQKANKTKHVKIHKEGAKPYTCGVCGRSFSNLEEMILHRAGHGGGKPRKCDYCEERFRTMSELSQHTRRYHTFEKPHKCAFCLKSFSSMYNLKQHVMVHTGQKPYSCSHCDLKFTQKGNLTKHFERKHADYMSCGDKCIIVERENCDDTKEEGTLMLANDLSKDTNDTFIIEREETIELEMVEENIDNSNLQMYEID